MPPREQVSATDPGRRAALEVVHRVRALATAYERRIDEVAAEAGLHRTDLRALVVLLDAERDGRGTTAGELARALGMTTQATTALLRRLESTGQVSRTRSDADGRRVVLTVSDAAIELGWRVFGPVVDPLAEAASGLDDAERETVLAFLDRARTALLEN